MDRVWSSNEKDAIEYTSDTHTDTSYDIVISQAACQHISTYSIHKDTTCFILYPVVPTHNQQTMCKCAPTQPVAESTTMYHRHFIIFSSFHGWKYVCSRFTTPNICPFKVSSFLRVDRIRQTACKLTDARVRTMCKVPWKRL